MDAATVRAMIEQHVEYGRSDPARAHAMYHEDAVLEFPQSGERFVGVESFSEWRSNYPASTAFEFREVRGGDDLWVVELSITYDQGPENFGVSILELRGDKIARESIYVAEGFEAGEMESRAVATTRPRTPPAERPGPPPIATTPGRSRAFGGAGGAAPGGAAAQKCTPRRR